MDVLAISYHNIGPFRQKTLSVIFHHGKFLIQAPIGSGKSFLFFDGPIYGLYKYSTRKMIHIEEKKGFIKLLFTHQDQLYLIVREISAAKAKDSCKSRLFSIHDIQAVRSLFARHTDTLYDQRDIQDILRDAHIDLDELTFKNETDLQQNLDQLLPPRQVFVSTVFLMQDSPNIFELTPTERLLVLKNVFNLLDIDQAKDVIADRKKQLQTEKKILSDTSQMDHKLQHTVATILQSINKLSSIALDLGDLKGLQHFAEELALIREKIGISGFDLGAWDDSMLALVREKIAHYRHTESVLLHEQQTIGLEIDRLQQQKHTIQQDMNNTKGTIQHSVKNIEILQGLSIDILQDKDTALSEKQHNLRGTIRHDTIQSFAGQTFDNRHSMYQFLNDSINEGKLLAESYKLREVQYTQLQQNLQDIQLQESQIELKPGTLWFDKLQKVKTQIIITTTHELHLTQQQYNHLITLQNDYTQELEKLEQHLATLLDGDDDRVQACLTKIRALLSVDRAIEKELTHILASYIGGDQIHTIQDRMTVLRSKIQDITNNPQLSVLSTTIAALEKKITDIETDEHHHLHDFMQERKQATTDIAHKKKILLTQIDALQSEKNHTTTQHRIESIKKFLLDVDWKYIQQTYTDYQTLQQQRDVLQQDLRKAQELQQELHILQQKKIEGETRLAFLTKQYDDIVQQHTLFIEKQTVVQNSLSTYPHSAVQEADTILQAIQSYIDHIRYLIADYAHNKIKVKSLLEQEEAIGNLYTIFSKELLLLVLSESLPVLADIINVFLAQVVPFQLQLRVVGEDDKLELEAIISDNHGSREVKSLSGGQRVILKLVWMLALSSFMRSPLLFLDETINNLDKDTVGIVADMLADFIKKNDIKLYTITHSEQIQSMGIWDGIVQL